MGGEWADKEKSINDHASIRHVHDGKQRSYHPSTVSDNRANAGIALETRV